MALIQFAADCNANRCKSCGHSARIFCTYLERAGRNSELTPCESRSHNRPGLCPWAPHAVCLNHQPKSPRAAKGNAARTSVLEEGVFVWVLAALRMKTRGPKSTSLGCAFIAPHIYTHLLSPRWSAAGMRMSVNDRCL